jgi:hypothetical protein
VPVSHVVTGEERRQLLAAELGMASGVGHGADVSELTHLVGLEECEKRFG